MYMSICAVWCSCIYLSESAIAELADHVPVLGRVEVVPDVVKHLLLFGVISAAQVQHLKRRK